jgi:hypothetical protein
MYERTALREGTRGRCGAAGSTRDAELLNHARECAVCAEVLLVREFLREAAQLAPQEIENLPNATLV